MKSHTHNDECCCCRRVFLQTVSLASGALVLTPSGSAGQQQEPAPSEKKTPTVRGAFIYPPSESLRKAGYWSWPGSSFDAEGHQRSYTKKFDGIAKQLKMHLTMDRDPLDDDASVARFIESIKQTKPDGLVLVLFKKLHFTQLQKVLEATKLPTVAVVPLGVLLHNYIQKLQKYPKLVLVNSHDVFEPVTDALKAMAAARRMRDSLLINIEGKGGGEAIEPHLGTHVRHIAHARFTNAFAQTKIDDKVKQLSAAYTRGAQEVVEPGKEDLEQAARSYFALKRLIDEEKADAMMMSCLQGLRKPRTHVPPCMGFMSLHDEGIVAGCQSDLEATLSMMLVRHLFDRPAFMNNPSYDTVHNEYYCAHCTAPSRMAGYDAPSEPYILRSHAEAGWGCVPQVLFSEGQEMTMLHYFPGKSPKMSLYTGKVARCYPKLPGGCRTNLQMTINEVDDMSKLVLGGHQVVFYGNGSNLLRTFCRLNGIELCGV